MMDSILSPNIFGERVEQVDCYRPRRKDSLDFELVWVVVPEDPHACDASLELLLFLQLLLLSLLHRVRQKHTIMNKKNHRSIFCPRCSRHHSMTTTTTTPWRQ